MNHHFNASSPYAGQIHSRDYLIRIRPASLRALAFEHLATMPDAAVLEEAGAGHAPPGTLTAGSTEWQASHGPMLISLAWDWVWRPGKAPAIWTAVAPRTNLMLIEPKGYDLAPAEMAAQLFTFIEGLSWHTQVLQVVKQECALTYSIH